MKDVAQEAGVAVETVSRVLNNRGYISKKTRARVELAMEELNYRPNEFARGLSKKNMDTIAIIVPHITHPYFSRAISCLEKETTRRGYKLLLFNSSDGAEREKQVLELCQSSFVNGVLLYSYDISAEKLMRFRVPIVTSERMNENGAGSVRCDNELGGRLAAEHLIERGCRRLVVFGSVLDVEMPAIGREESFLRVCADAGAACRVYKSSPEDYATLDYHRFLRGTLSECGDCDGIFATSDVIAAQVIQECARMGRRIPEDVKLIGFDDSYLADLTTPRLTSLRQPVEEMTTAALDIIESWNDGLTGDQKNLTFPVTLTVRESTGG